MWGCKLGGESITAFSGRKQLLAILFLAGNFSFELAAYLFRKRAKFAIAKTRIDEFFRFE
jgi:hypothetical protein